MFIQLYTHDILMVLDNYIQYTNLIIYRMILSLCHYVFYFASNVTFCF